MFNYHLLLWGYHALCLILSNQKQSRERFTSLLNIFSSPLSLSSLWRQMALMSVLSCPSCNLTTLPSWTLVWTTGHFFHSLSASLSCFYKLRNDELALNSIWTKLHYMWHIIHHYLILYWDLSYLHQRWHFFPVSLLLILVYIFKVYTLLRCTSDSLS